MNSATEELLSYLRTIANFGGTLEQAKALAAKAVDSIGTCNIPLPDVAYEIVEDGILVATASNPRDASEYAGQYSRSGGDVEVFTVVRSSWEGPFAGRVR